MSEGKCLCGSVTWELTAEPFAAYNCHCKMCQKVHGTPFGTYYFVRPDQFRWTSDTDSIIHYRSSHVLTRCSCDVCGSAPSPELSFSFPTYWSASPARRRYRSRASKRA